MDIREIQRLHAQFAPDSMVIDLPRQIAALPAPGDLSDEPTTLGARARWANAGPAARGTLMAVAAAALLAMAGMGAASLYTAWRSGHHAAPTAEGAATTPASEGTPTTAAANPSGVALREIDATPARPVSTAPTLSAADFGSGKALVLTADQFRDSLKAPSRQPSASASPAASPAPSTEAQLAAVSPIHRAGPSRATGAAAPQPAPATTSAPATQAAGQKTSASAQPASAQVPTTQAQVAAQPAPEPAVATQQAEAKKPPTHPAHRHVSRPRAEQPAETDSNAKPAVTNRAGASEVQMF
jgi:hypothetical protein